MPAPLDPAKRDAIAQAIRDGGKRNEIARQHDVSPSTVTGIAKQEGLTDAFDRTQTKRATEARNADLASRRAELATKLMDRAFWLEAQIDQERPYIARSKDGVEVIMSVPEPKDIQALMTSVGIAVDKVGVLTRDDAEGLTAVDAWLKSITGM